jgi:hypothetical protein
MTKYELVFYFLLNLVPIILVAIYFAHLYSRLDRKIDHQESIIIDKVIKMFRDAFRIINNNKNLL